MSRILFTTFFLGVLASVSQGCNDTGFSSVISAQKNNDRGPDLNVPAPVASSGPIAVPNPGSPPVPVPSSPPVLVPVPAPTAAPVPVPVPTSVPVPVPAPVPVPTSDPAPVPAPTSAPMPVPMPSVVCDPFGGSAGGSAENGLEAKLTYLPSNAEAISRGLSTTSFAIGAPDVVVSPSKLILSQLNVSTRPFTEGFADSASGTKLKNLDGEDLIEYFSVQAESRVRLAGKDKEGDYEFALMADDGAILDLDPSMTGKSFERWVDNDGTHGNTLGCSTKRLHIAAGEEIPIRMNYYQGPRVRIALMMLWREKKASEARAEEECGMGRGDTYYFESGKKSASEPTSNYHALLGRGWKVLSPENFVLPNAKTVNPCAKK
ncbi:MAG: hypothetical protein H7301_01340 [Cryobacterium sp.]|nr:hypothetical protein [Oligoflexia bacterium]